MTYKHLILTKHATQRKLERRISLREIEHVLLSGEVIEKYPNDKPYPSRLMLGFIGTCPIHVVAADNHEAKETYVITVYEPEQGEWDRTFRRRAEP